MTSSRLQQLVSRTLPHAFQRSVRGVRIESKLKSKQLEFLSAISTRPIQSKRLLSSFVNTSTNEEELPSSLFTTKGSPSIHQKTQTLLHKKASVKRTFTPNSNAQAMLICGGEELAAHASFDPVYERAKKFIHNHPIGPAVLSPILISGLVGALIESTLPQSFYVSSTMNQLRPLIVGVEVEANIEVVSVKECGSDLEEDFSNDSFVNGNTLKRYSGYELLLDTEVKRVNDGAIISHGTQTIWLPEY
jgi:hypothetical protein